MSRAIRFVLGFVLFVLGACDIWARDYKVYCLGGQSNMDGYGYVSELPPAWNTPRSGVMIFHGNPAADNTPVDGRGLWTELQPGHGVGFTSDGQTNQYSDRFGIELSFAHRLKEMDPDTAIALIKYSRGGTSIDIAAAYQFGCWDPDYEAGNGVNQYDHFLASVRNAFASRDIDGDGQEDRLIPAGIIWMQGESDAAWGEDIALRYEANLKRLVHLIRAALRVDDLPVVIGRISDSGREEEDGMVWNHGARVREAQANFVRKDAGAFLVGTTDQYGYSDKWHYDTNGYIGLGREFADAVLRIQP